MQGVWHGQVSRAPLCRPGGGHLTAAWLRSYSRLQAGCILAADCGLAEWLQPTAGWLCASIDRVLSQTSLSGRKLRRQGDGQGCWWQRVSCCLLQSALACFAAAEDGSHSVELSALACLLPDVASRHVHACQPTVTCMLVGNRGSLPTLQSSGHCYLFSAGCQADAVVMAGGTCGCVTELQHRRESKLMSIPRSEPGTRTAARPRSRALWLAAHAQSPLPNVADGSFTNTRGQCTAMAPSSTWAVG